MHLRPVGPHALLVEVAGAREARSLAAWARSARLDVAEVVPAASTVLLDGVTDVEAVRARLAAWTPDDRAAPEALVEVPVTYDGADLAFVAEHWGTDVEGVVARHTGTLWVSSFCGFAPGFAYLAGLDGEHDGEHGGEHGGDPGRERAVPRLETPRARVPAGSVALAGPWCGIYPTASPGGWRLLGRTDLVLWDPSRPAPALLAPGTRVRFVRA